jgi:hypothetical protein
VHYTAHRQLHGESGLKQGASTMPEHLFDVSRIEYSLPQAVTDTATSLSLIPMYFIHSFEQPFCAEAACPCSAHRQEVVRLFVKVVEGHFALEKAADFLDENGRENRA